MKSIFAAAIGLSTALSAAPASALSEYAAIGDLFLVFEAGPNIEARVEFVENEASDVFLSGNADAFGSSGVLVDGVGVSAFIEGDADAPGGTSNNALLLDVDFIFENTGPIPLDIGGQEESFVGLFRYDIAALALADLPGEFADATVAITGLNFESEFQPSAFISITEFDEFDEEFGDLIEVSGSLFPGQSVSYSFIFDLTGFAFSPGEPGEAEVPLPAAGAMLILGLGALAATRRRRKA